MLRRKIAKKGFNLCVMICGNSGTGKSTFINTLCKNSQETPQCSHLKPTEYIEVHERFVQLTEEDESCIHLTIVDTPGFGDSIDNSNSCDNLVRYLERQYDDILLEEQRVKRNPRFKDNRVHAVLYFISPTGHGLKELDIDLMMSLSARANVIPILSKADTLTLRELELNKQVIMEDIKHFNIPIYNFPYDNSSDDENIAECLELRQMIPFTVIGSTDFCEVGNISGKQGNQKPQLVPAREYPWGTASVEDPFVSDFKTLRAVLFGSHLQELKDLTHEILYEKYRTEKLSENNPGQMEELVGYREKEKDDSGLSSYKYTSTASKRELVNLNQHKLSQTQRSRQKQPDRKLSNIQIQSNQRNFQDARNEKDPGYPLQRLDDIYQRDVTQRRAELTKREKEWEQFRHRMGTLKR